MHPKPQATQTVKVMPSGKWETVRYAECPLHIGKPTAEYPAGKPQLSSAFRGVDSEGWIFQCAETKVHTGHRFTAKPPRNAPRTVEEAQEWFKAEVDRKSKERRKVIQ
jgi:hypothetical protein